MNSTWRENGLAVCRLLGDAASGRTANINSLADEACVFAFCKAHRLETLVSSALRTVGVDNDAFRSLHDVAEKAAFHQIKSDLSATTVIADLTANGVPATPLKGAALQAVYPAGWVRTATDTDLYIPPSHMDTAIAVLTQHGFCEKSAKDGEYGYQKPPRSVIELHTTLGGYTKRQKQALARLADTPFTVNEHYVYTLFHLYKHFVSAGAGVRLFFDMYCLFSAELNRDRIEKWLEALDLLPFERAVRTVCGVLFDGDEADDAMREAVDTVLISGTFGTIETYHAIKLAAHSVTHKRHFAVWLNDYGFTRKAMTARFPILERHIWLYPVCAVKRIVHGIIFKRKVIVKAVKAAHALDPRQMTRVLQTMHIL